MVSARIHGEPAGLTLIAQSGDCASRSGRSGGRLNVGWRHGAALKARLIEIIKERSFQSGREMKLASGRTSTYYFNMKPTMLDAEGAHLIAHADPRRHRRP